MSTGLNFTSVVALAMPFFVDTPETSPGSLSLIGGGAGYSGSISGRPGFGNTAGLLASVPPAPPPAKYAPSALTPVLTFQNAQSWFESDSPVWADRNVVVTAVGSFLDYFLPVKGIAAPASTAAYRASGTPGVSNYAGYNASLKLDVDNTHLLAKAQAHADHDARVLCDVLYKQGLLRGSGPIGGGGYGGAFHHHELFSNGNFDPAAAPYAWTALFYHPDDAAQISRTQTIKTGPSTSRISTLFKLTVNGGPPSPGLNATASPAATGAQNRAAVEATAAARGGHFFGLVATYGIAGARVYTDRLADAVKALCDSYTPPGGGSSVQLVYPAFVLHDLEDNGFAAHFHSPAYITADSPDTDSTPSGYYYVGCLWHVRGDINDPSAVWTGSTIYNSGPSFGTPMTYKSAIEADPVIASWSTRYAPALGVSSALTAEEYLHFDRLTRHAVDHALYKAMNEYWKSLMPLTQFSNYDGVVVKDDAVPYERVGAGGPVSIQKIMRQDRQGPSLYGYYGATHPLVLAIKNAVGQPAIDAAVAAWNAASLVDALKIVDEQIDLNAAPVDAYVYGVYSTDQLRAGATELNQWGGDKEFFKSLVKALYSRGIYHYVVFSGDPDLTYAAWLEAKADIDNGNF